MTEKDFIKNAKTWIVDYTNNETFSTENYLKISKHDVCVVWCCKTLQNWKALLVTYLEDGIYFEVTYNGDKNEMYFDVYKKLENREVKL